MWIHISWCYWNCFFGDFRFQTTPNPQIGYIKLNYPNVSHDIPIIIVYTQSVLLTWTWICPLDLLQNKHHTESYINQVGKYIPIRTSQRVRTCQQGPNVYFEMCHHFPIKLSNWCFFNCFAYHLPTSKCFISNYITNVFFQMLYTQVNQTWQQEIPYEWVCWWTIHLQDLWNHSEVHPFLLISKNELPSQYVTSQ